MQTGLAVMHLNEGFRGLHEEHSTWSDPSKLPQVGAKWAGLYTTVSLELSCFSLACFQGHLTAEYFLSVVLLPARMSL